MGEVWVELVSGIIMLVLLGRKGFAGSELGGDCGCSDRANIQSLHATRVHSSCRVIGNVLMVIHHIIFVRDVVMVLDSQFQ